MWCEGCVSSSIRKKKKYKALTNKITISELNRMLGCLCWPFSIWQFKTNNMVSIDLEVNPTQINTISE
jgi:hypothetical protein